MLGHVHILIACGPNLAVTSDHLLHLALQQLIIKIARQLHMNKFISFVIMIDLFPVFHLDHILICYSWATYQLIKFCGWFNHEG